MRARPGCRIDAYTRATRRVRKARCPAIARPADSYWSQEPQSSNFSDARTNGKPFAQASQSPVAVLPILSERDAASIRVLSCRIMYSQIRELYP